MRKPFIAGIVANALALLAAILSFPFLLLPLLKLAFLGLVVNAPIGFLLFSIGVVLIDVGPLVGMAVSVVGRVRALGIATAVVSLVSLGALIAGMNVLGLHPFTEDGRATGPAPAGCKQKTADGTAVGRHCNPEGGAEPAGDCPAEYFCMEKIVDHPETTECSIYCSHDCECPKHLKCVYNSCVR